MEHDFSGSSGAPGAMRLGVLAALVGSIVLLAAVWHSRKNDPSVPELKLDVAPASTSADPGPAVIFGAPAEPAGTSFISADATVEGPGDLRVYFDRRDTGNYHFADRIGTTIKLGLSEAGVEQLLGTGKISGTGKLRVARHGPNIAIFEGHKLIVSAFDDRVIGGSVGMRMLQNSAAPAVLAVEGRDDIRFADDFMLAESRGAQWRGNGSAEKGDFGVKSLRNPLLSANAFNYMGVGHNIHSLTGETWWDNYQMSISLRGPVGSAIGLVFAYQDAGNYGLFRWTARKTDATGNPTDPGMREIVRVLDGKEEVLIKQTGGYVPDQWYNAMISLNYNRVRIALDGFNLLEVNDPYLACGGAGVWCDVAKPAVMAVEPKAQNFQDNYLNDLMRQHAVFDDVRIATLNGFEDDFIRTGALSNGWMTGTGDWAVKQSKDARGPVGELTVLPLRGASKALIGDRSWSQYIVDAVILPGSGPSGLVFLHRDEGNYYTAVIDDGQLKLNRMIDGKEQLVDSVALGANSGPGPFDINVSIKHGHVKATEKVTGASVETFDGDAMLRGRAGFIAAAPRAGAGAPTAFRKFRLSFLPEAEPLVTTNAVFEEEATMNDWTSASSEWYPPRDQLLIDGRPVSLLWHRSQFPGDVELMVEPREFHDDKYEIALSTAKDGSGKNNGYVFRYKAGQGEGASRTTHLSLYRQGELVADKSVADEGRQLSSLAMRRCGKYIVGLANGRPLIHFRDDQPLSGSKVAFYTQGLAVRTEATRITSNRFYNEMFSSAPANWRTSGAAMAEVVNRWQCDPRWSFFCLRNDRKKGKPAVLWSKKLYPGDVSVEFFVANRMEGERGQPYTYARDINVTISSDGQDLTKGYTFMWGGMGNTASVILRDGVEVKRIGKSIPTDMNYHRHWFNYKVERQGNKLTFRVDRFFAPESGKRNQQQQSELVYEDSMPLNGDHVAIWTYDHAIMLSRVRISGDGGDVLEDVDWTPGALKTPYDDR